MNQIAGGLRFGSGGAGALSNPQAAYQQSYMDARNLNQQNYNNIITGYQQASSAQQAGQASTAGMYRQLLGATIGDLQGRNQAVGQRITDQYRTLSGQASQRMVDRGLGNSTVQAGVQRGILLDSAKAGVEASDAYARTIADYRSRIGLAGLDYLGQTVRDQTSLAQSQLGFMNSVTAGYPNPQAYSDLARQAGAVGQGAPSGYYGGNPAGGAGLGGGNTGPGIGGPVGGGGGGAGARRMAIGTAYSNDNYQTGEPPLYYEQTAEPPLYGGATFDGGIGGYAPGGIQYRTPPGQGDFNGYSPIGPFASGFIDPYLSGGGYLTNPFAQ